MKLTFTGMLTKLAKKDPRIVVLTGDLGFQIFDDFVDKFGPRYINVGVAEAQMMCAAAGLAYEGWRPVAYSIASFATARCFEQIKISIAYPGLPVVIVGAGGGYAYGASGVTHHAGDDIGLMRTLPGMSIIAPGDSDEINQLLPQIFKLKGPAYLRIGRGREPQYKAKEDAVLGKARLLSQGEDIAIISTGEVASEVSTAIDILSKKNINPMALQYHTIKPLDTARLHSISEKIKTIIVVEEHIPAGGLSCAIKDWAFDECGFDIDIRTLSVPHEFVLGSPSQNEIRAMYGFNAEAIAGFVEKTLDEKVKVVVRKKS